MTLNTKIESIRDNSRSTEYEQYYVAFLDILGFKEILKSASQSDVLSIFESISDWKIVKEALALPTDAKGGAESKIKSNSRYNEALAGSIIYIMSDSIVVAAKSDCEEALAAVIDICDLIQQLLYQMGTPILLRGAIAKGNLYIGGARGGNSRSAETDDGKGVNTGEEITSTIIFGQGLVDAYLAQESYAVYPRVIVSKGVQNEALIGDGNNVIDTSQIDYEFQRLIRDSEDDYYYINSLEKNIIHSVDFYEKEEQRQGREFKAIEDYRKFFKNSADYLRFMRLIEDNLNGYTDPRIRKKYMWIRNELDRIEKEYMTKKGLIPPERLGLILEK